MVIDALSQNPRNTSSLRRDILCACDTYKIHVFVLPETIRREGGFYDMIYRIALRIGIFVSSASFFLM